MQKLRQQFNKIRLIAVARSVSFIWILGVLAISILNFINNKPDVAIWQMIVVIYMISSLLSDMAYKQLEKIADAYKQQLEKTIQAVMFISQQTGQQNVIVREKKEKKQTIN